MAVPLCRWRKAIQNCRVSIFRGLFATQGARAMAWAVIGALGLAFAAVGVALMTEPASGTRSAARPDAMATPAVNASSEAGGSAVAGSAPVLVLEPTATPSAEPSASPSPTATATVRAAATAQPQAQGPTLTRTPEPAPATVEPTPTAPAVVAGGGYCDLRTSGRVPDGRVAGALVIDGRPMPAGTVVTLAFDGVPGPSRATDTTGEYRVDFYIGGSSCANRSGAGISVIVNGVAYSSGRGVPSSGSLVPFSINN